MRLLVMGNANVFTATGSDLAEDTMNPLLLVRQLGSAKTTTTFGKTSFRSAYSDSEQLLMSQKPIVPTSPFNA